jgi:signal transduction histidine kinase
MKYNLFYSPFFIILFLMFIATSCIHDKKDLSVQEKQLVAQINLKLEQSHSDSLSVRQKLEYINQSIALATKANIDSLILKTTNKKAETYNLFYPDSAFTVLQDFEKLAKAKNDTLYLGYSYLNYGDYYNNLKQDSASFSNFNKSKIEFENIKDSSLVVYSLLMMSSILKEKNDYYDMEAINTEALNFVSQTNRNYNYSAIYVNLGIASKETFDFEKSLYYYKKALQYAEDEFSKVTIQNNIAVVYTLLGQPLKAIAILSALKKSKIIHENEVLKARVLCNLGFAYFKLNNPEALKYLLESLAIREKTNDNYGLISSYTHLAEYYQLHKDKELAKKYASKSYQIGSTLGVIDERLHALTILSETSSVDQSSKYSATYFRLNDSINKVREKNKNQFAKIRYDFTLAKEQNLKLKKEEAERSLKLAQSENQKLTLSFLGLIGIVFAFLRFNYIKQRNKKLLLLEGYSTEVRIAKQLHDELANDVFYTMTFAETQDLQNPEKREALLGNLDKIYSRTRNISGENSTIETGEKFEANLKEMISGYKNNQVNIIIRDNKEIDWLKVETGKKIAVHRIVQELMVNMKKHSNCTLTIIGFSQKEKQIEIHYSDNGKGSEKVNLENGLQNMENRIRGIKGTITFDSEIDKGFKVKISFPK